jgi:hypothetical protein
MIDVVSVARPDALCAIEALGVTAASYRVEARRRSNGGSDLREYRAHLRLMADNYDGAAARIQRAAGVIA